MITGEMSPATHDHVVTNMANGALSGSELRVLVRQDPDEGGFSLVHIWFKPDYPLPRHVHDVDCLYYVISGTLHMGSQTLQAGDSFFVPAGAPYGYYAGSTGVEVLEIRHGVSAFDISILDAAPAQWQKMLETLKEHDSAWKQLERHPTFAE